MLSRPPARAEQRDSGRMQIRHEQREPRDFPSWRFETFDFDYDAATRSTWMSFKADGPHCFTFQTLTDLSNIRLSLRGLFGSDVLRRYPIDYLVMASRKPGVFNLGGDLALFASAIRTGRRDVLRAYAHSCIDVMHAGISAFGLPIVTVALIAGKALGGGFEAALANDVLLAEESAMLGVPEVAFNTFPGMGAVSLLNRRIGAGLTERLISGGRIYTASEMASLGVVDRVVPDGRIEAAARDWMREGGEEGRARRLAVVEARRTCFPVSLTEMMRIVDVWTDCSLDITPNDLRHMERLAAAQDRMVAAP